MFPWIDGAIRDADAVSAADATAQGQTLGAIHRVARARWPAHGRAGIYQWPDVVGRLATIAAAGRAEHAPVHAELVAAVA